MSIRILRPLKKSRETHKYIKLNRLFTVHTSYNAMDIKNVHRTLFIVTKMILLDMISALFHFYHRILGLSLNER
jgi:hypothetical protein